MATATLDDGLQLPAIALPRNRRAVTLGAIEGEETLPVGSQKEVEQRGAVLSEDDLVPVWDSGIGVRRILGSLIQCRLQFEGTDCGEVPRIVAFRTVLDEDLPALR